MPKLHLVSTCTDRKVTTAPEPLRARSLPAGGVTERSTAWVDRLSSWPGDPMPAVSMYAGELWTEARHAAKNVDTLSVVSAGYGLVSAATEIQPYSATFQTAQPDSVTTHGCDATAWWRALNGWAGPSGRRPLLGSLAQSGIVLLAASPPYLSVLDEEVSSLDPERVLVISAGASATQLPDHQLPASGRARLCLGGSLVAINTRIARFLIETLGSSVNRESATGALQRLLATAPELPQHNRRRLDDEQVIDSILRIRVQHPSISATGAHRHLRDEGFACEQQRFKALFGEALRRSA